MIHFKTTLLGIYALCLLSINGYAQEGAKLNPKTEARKERLIYGGVMNLNFAHTSYGDYYAGGGLGTLNIGGLVDIYSTTQITETKKSTWDNNLRISYGLVRRENRNDDKFVKSSDDFDYISKFGTPIGQSTKWFYSTAVNFQTQLTDTRTTYDEDLQEFSKLKGQLGGEFGTKQSNFLAPADLSLGIGIEYKPNENLSIFTGPASGKLRFVMDENIAKSGLFGNEVIYDENNEVIGFENTRSELGANLLANFQDKFWEKDRLGISTNLKLFSNYLDKPDNVDVNWNTLSSLHPWKYVSVTYTTNVAYDDNKQFTSFANGNEIENGPAKGVQFKSVLGVGFNYTLNENFKKKKIVTDRLITTDWRES